MDPNRTAQLGSKSYKTPDESTEAKANVKVLKPVTPAAPALPPVPKQ
jgi:hypothetical protein